MLIITLIVAIILQAVGAWMAFCGLVSITLITAHGVASMRAVIAEAFGVSTRQLITCSIVCTIAGLVILLIGAWLAIPFGVAA